MGAARVLLRHGVGMKRIDRGIDVPSHRMYKLFHGRWWQGKRVRVDAPHFMEPAGPDEIADALRDVIATAGS